MSCTNNCETGGTSRLITIPSGVLPASSIPTDTTNFTSILSSADDTVQKALDTLDGVVGSYSPVFTFATPGDLSVVYGQQVGDYQQFGKYTIVSGRILFTPTYTTAAGAGYFSLPFANVTNTQLGNANELNANTPIPGTLVSMNASVIAFSSNLQITYVISTSGTGIFNINQWLSGLQHKLIWTVVYRTAV